MQHARTLIARAGTNSTLLRTASLMLLCTVPHCYLTDILPLAVLPVWALCCTLTVYLLRRKRLRTQAIWSIAITGSLLIPTLFCTVLALIPHIIADTLFLHIRLLFGIFVLTAFISITATVLFITVPVWKRFEPLTAILLFCLFFISEQHYQLKAFSHPLFAIGFAGIFMLMQISLLIMNTGRYRHCALFLLVFTGVTALILVYCIMVFNKRTVSNNGGLLEQKLFTFNFPHVLQLQDEITMNTSLVMVVHVDKNYDSHLFRRMYLSGWSKEKGFYEQAAPDEVQQTLHITGSPAELPHRPFICRERVSQEIFAVNIAPDSLIALEYPLSIIPYTVWDTVRFTGAYKVESEVLHGVPLDLITAEPPSGNPQEGLSQEDLQFYTAIDTGTQALLFPIAEAVTAPFARYYDKVYALLDYFREGEYRYSLKPGQAPDGDKLRYFVTESKKGYCVYFAFAYCLMLRSLGIPARLAAGFFLQPESGVLNYYPVRTNMAHAWVQVFFPYLGWIDLDPTTDQLAEGEALDLSFQAGGNQFTELLNEIIVNRSSLGIQHDDNSIYPANHTPLTKRIVHFFNNYRKILLGGGILMLLLGVVIFALYPHLIISFSHNNRKIILTLKRIHKHPSADFHALTQKAKFAPQCTDEDAACARQLYTTEKRQKYKRTSKNLSLFWIFKDKHNTKSDKRPPHGGMFILFLCLLLPLPLYSTSNAEELLQKADTAIQAENWDTAAVLLKEGITCYPTNELFQLKLGEMYFNQGLYELAYRHFIEGLTLNRYNIKLLYGAANAAAALNKEEKARTVLREYLTLNPTDILGWAKYGWLCFKTHRTDEGINAVLDARKNYGDDGCLANALGNLYGELLDYQHASFYYQKGIERALQNNSFYSASVYCYNKAILEAEFYHFEQAEKDARDAIDYFPRSSGYLILGELEEKKNNFAAAIRFYRQAVKEHATPLPLISLAKLYLRMGYWEKAEQTITHIERITDSSWIANFGMSTVQFYTELYHLYLTLYEKKYISEKIRVAESMKDFFLRTKNLMSYTALIWYYRSLVSIYNLKLAREYTQTDTDGKIHKLYTQSFYYRAFEPIPFKAQRYLNRAEVLETSVIPKAQASYTAQRGILLRDEHLLRMSLETLDPLWERNVKEQTVTALLRCTQNRTLQTELIRELLKNNRACLAAHTIRLPIRLTVTGKDETIKKKAEYYLSDALKQSVFTLTRTAPFCISAVCTEHTVQLSLADKDGTVYVHYNHPAAVTGKYTAAVCVNAFTQRLFRVPEETPPSAP